MVVEVSLVATRYGPWVMTGRVSKTLYGSDCARASTGAAATNAAMASRRLLILRMGGFYVVWRSSGMISARDPYEPHAPIVWAEPQGNLDQTQPGSERT